MLSRIQARDTHLKEHTKNRRDMYQVIHTTLHSHRYLQIHPLIIILFEDIYRQLLHLKCPGITRAGYAELCELVTVINLKPGRVECSRICCQEFRPEIHTWKIKLKTGRDMYQESYTQQFILIVTYKSILL